MYGLKFFDERRIAGARHDEALVARPSLVGVAGETEWPRRRDGDDDERSEHDCGACRGDQRGAGGPCGTDVTSAFLSRPPGATEEEPG